MSARARERFWTDAALSAVSGVLLVVTVAYPQWVEAAFGVDPDGGSGALEWTIVAALFVLTAAFGALARREWRTDVALERARHRP